MGARHARSAAGAGSLLECAVRSHKGRTFLHSFYGACLPLTSTIYLQLVTHRPKPEVYLAFPAFLFELLSPKATTGTLSSSVTYNQLRDLKKGSAMAKRGSETSTEAFFNALKRLLGNLSLANGA